MLQVRFEGRKIKLLFLDSTIKFESFMGQEIVSGA